MSRAFLVASTIVVTAPMVDAQSALAAVGDQRREVERVVDELERLHEQADILAEDYAVAVDEETQLKAEIDKAAERVAEKEAELDRVRGDLSAVAVRAFTGAGSDVLGPLFSDASAYTDTLAREQFSRIALDVGMETTDDLDELIRELDEERADLEDKRARQADLILEIDAKLEEVKELTAAYVERRAEAEAKLTAAIIAEEEALRDAAALDAIRAQQGGGNNGGGNNGGGNDGGGNDGGGNDGGGNDGGGNDGGGNDGGGNNGGGNDGGGNSGGFAPPVSGLAGTAISAAQGQIGVPYKYATSSPGVSFDCSGLTHYAWGQAGVYLPRNSRAQAAATPSVSIGDAQPGDLIFYYSPISHVGIYIGGSQLIHAPNSGTTVKVSSVSWGKVTYVGRPG